MESFIVCLFHKIKYFESQVINDHAQRHAYNRQFGLNMKGRNELEDMGINGKILLNCISREGKEIYCTPSANDEFKDGDI
jgi:hypothetical protein